MENLALVVDPTAPNSIAFSEVPEPGPKPTQAVVAVLRVSLNHGDLNDATSGRLSSGDVLGSDVAGVVVQSAADGSGPQEGERVVGLAAGAFAKRVAIDSSDLAPLPGSVELEVAAGLPVAGLAALRSLRAAGELSGRRVLVTGASGGVGTFTVQLAADAGAHVIASVGEPGRGEGLQALGASEVVVGLEEVAAIDVVIDSVGGPQMVQAWKRLTSGGVLVSVGWTSGEPAVFSPYATVGPQKSLTSHLNLPPFGADLSTLVQLVEKGALRVAIGMRVGLAEFARAADALLERRVRGKAILDAESLKRPATAEGEVTDS
jgi:NADPH:quinone reductase-like Zn-dependent oxidoreductase